VTALTPSWLPAFAVFAIPLQEKDNGGAAL